MPLTFSGASNQVVQKNLTASVSFSGGEAKKIERLWSASLSFVGYLLIPFVVILSSVLSFAGNAQRMIQRKISAILSFGYPLITKALNASLPFVGSLSPSYTVPMLLTAALNFGGQLHNAFTQLLTGALSFAGSFVGSRVTQHIFFLVSNLNFIGSLSSSRIIGLFQQTFTAVLSMNGNINRAINYSLPASLSFVGTLIRQTSGFFQQALNASIGFAGDISRSTIRPLLASLPVVGSHIKTVTRQWSATIALAGSVTKQLLQSFGATLGLVGRFTVSQLANFLGITLTAALDFSGSLQGNLINLFTQSFSAALAFGSNLTRFTTRQSFVATLSMTGQALRRIGLPFNAAISFVGALVSRHIYGQLLTGTLRFVGSTQRQTMRTMTAAVTMAGTVTRRLNKAITATLQFLGIWQQSIETPFSTPVDKLFCPTDTTAYLVVYADGVLDNLVDYKMELIEEATTVITQQPDLSMQTK